MVKAVVTGGAGFIGSHIAELLIQKGHDVIVIDLLSDSTSGRMKNMASVMAHPKFAFVNGDIRKPADLAKLFDDHKDVEWVFHMAGLADIVPSITNPRGYFETNVLGTFNVLEAAKTAGVKKLVYAASSSSYGIATEFPTSETAPISPEYPYALTKYQGEELVLHWGKVYGMATISLRLFNVYGPRSRTTGTYGAVFGVFMGQKINKKPFTVVGDGTQTRDFTYVTDVAEAFLAAAENTTVQSDCFNVGSGGHYSVNELVDLLGGRENKVFIPKRPGEPDITFADIRKIRETLNWGPKVNIEQGVNALLQSIDDYKDAPVWEPKTIAKATEKWFEYLGNDQTNGNNDADYKPRSVLVVGGAGYVGSKLIPALLGQGYMVTVYDLYLYGDVFSEIKANTRLKQVRGDIRDLANLEACVEGVDTVIHLACISNDPSFELNPTLGKSINLDAFEPFVQMCVKHHVKRFVYASSSSVYGIKTEKNVHEGMSLEPLTDYSKFKAQCEKILAKYQTPDFTTVSVRPATVCGYGPRQRLDVIVNILTNHAYNLGKIKVTGGPQLRPNVHIDDMVDAYLLTIKAPKEKVAGEIFNVGHINHSVDELAAIVQRTVSRTRPCEIERVPTNDQRSYHVSSEKIARVLGFHARRTIEMAVQGLVDAMKAGKLKDTMTDPKYFNIQVMKNVNLE